MSELTSRHGFPVRREAGSDTSVVALGQALRAGGVRVGPAEEVLALRALAVVDPLVQEDARAALAAALCSRREDRAVFDVAWELVFGRGAEVQAVPDELQAASAALPKTAGPPAARQDEPGAEEPVARPAAWSELEVLRDKDFAAYTDAERALAHRLLVQLARRGPRRRSRRPVPRARGEVDLRRTLRASLRTGGVPVHLARRGPSTTVRPLVLLLDVSGSMAPYARVLLQWAQAAVVAHRRVECFAFGTRLTRITLELRHRDPDRALARAAAAVDDWSGGTRIGDAVATLNREHGRRLGRGAVVVVLSDGWDRGEPEVLADELARLQRSAHRLIWLNPLKAAPGYEPLARGMAAALPHADHFLAGHSLRALEELADLLDPPGGPVRA